jgi:hypothetical protein
MDPNTALTLTDDVTADLVRKKVTCPFLGSAVHQKFLAVRGDADNPLASIEDVRRLGNSGGGDLGDLLVMFASGNHAFMRQTERESPEWFDFFGASRFTGFSPWSQRHPALRHWIPVA